MRKGGTNKISRNVSRVIFAINFVSNGLICHIKSNIGKKDKRCRITKRKYLIYLRKRN